MNTTAIDNSKRHLLREELQAKFPGVNLRDMKSESVQEMISKISLITHQNENEIARIVDEKLEYVKSKSL